LRARAGDPCRLIIAGSGGGPAVLALARHPRISVLGRVPDIAPLYRRATLALAPLHSGGGTRIKMLEAAAHGTASVATERAAAGIGWPKDAGGWRVRNASEFAGACHAALASVTERDRRATRGLDWVTRYHSRPHVVSRLARAFLTALDRRRAGKEGETAG
jgi:glycosyltransferase involved in cell wall biosynthesis